MKTHILFLAWNRLEFTRLAFETLLANTDWTDASLTVWDDGSSDGTRQYLADASRGLGNFVRTNLGGPVAVFSQFLRSTSGRWASEFVAKIDNDTLVPPGWLGECLPMMKQTDLLGIEQFDPIGPGPRQVRPAGFIGGIGLMRRAVFHGDLPAPAPGGGRFGFGHWQDQHPEVRRGWLTPALPVCLLNLVPFEPWRELSQSYIAAGWQRDWPELYTHERHELWDWWKDAQIFNYDQTAEDSKAINSHSDPA